MNLLFEHYLKSAGHRRSGWFYKDLSDPISKQTTPTTGRSTGSSASPINGRNAHITGVEFAWQHLLPSRAIDALGVGEL